MLLVKYCWPVKERGYIQTGAGQMEKESKKEEEVERLACVRAMSFLITEFSLGFDPLLAVIGADTYL